ncbi:hypothetical protein E2C01_013943 [Portunus trituberculatus]|uniref:Uncharacterized protein n=1 Tax=Portunus trituberculatus TaxID=210409 RepID=A0A5B7DIM2_PORTR|nr:hypothetical protein [Portunus trituberculatus]
MCILPDASRIQNHTLKRSQQEAANIPHENLSRDFKRGRSQGQCQTVCGPIAIQVKKMFAVTRKSSKTIQSRDMEGVKGQRKIKK